MRIDVRWVAGDAARFQRAAEELLALAPDAILASATPSVQALQQLTRTVPIVFANVGDPVAMGFVDSLSHPGGNTTGFTPLEFGFAAKWLELLKEIAPRVTRVAVLRDLTIGPAHLSAIQAVAPSFGVELSVVDVRDVGEIECTIAAFARSSNAGLIVTPSTSVLIHRDLITMLAARHRLPAVYSWRYFVTAGGLISYGANSIDVYRRAAGYVDRILKGEKPAHRLPAVYSFRYFVIAGGLISYGANATDQYRRAAGYIDRILKGEKPADLPVQAPIKYELVINTKTAKALGLTVPDTLLAGADEVIE